MNVFLFLFFLCTASCLYAQPVKTGAVLPLGQVPVHDPVIIRQDSLYYIFCTGNGITVWSSSNLKDWKKEPPVFTEPPQWAVQAMPGFKGHIWAPDIQYYNGQYCLFYSVSQFGKNTSCIGVAVAKTLHRSSTDYGWKDLGKVVESVPGRDLWNAIDPNLIVDEKGLPWLAFGSFWGGLKMVRLHEDLKVAEPQQWYTLARRPRAYNTPDVSGGSAALEAPFLFKRNGYYYLFLSFDLCCKGEQSTYKIMVGRSRNLHGPYLDKEGVELNSNGGSLVRQGGAGWHGVGHNAVFTDNGKDYLVFHGYDAKDKGRSKLLIEELAWENDWPVSRQ